MAIQLRDKYEDLTAKEAEKKVEELYNKFYNEKIQRLLQEYLINESIPQRRDPYIWVNTSADNTAYWNKLVNTNSTYSMGTSASLSSSNYSSTSSSSASYNIDTRSKL